MKIILNIFLFTLTLTVFLFANIGNIKKSMQQFDDKSSEKSYIYFFEPDQFRFSTNEQKDRLFVSNELNKQIEIETNPLFFDKLYEDWTINKENYVMIPPNYCSEFYIKVKKSGFLIINTEFSLDNYISEWGCREN